MVGAGQPRPGDDEGSPCPATEPPIGGGNGKKEFCHEPTTTRH